MVGEAPRTEEAPREMIEAKEAFIVLSYYTKIIDKKESELVQKLQAAVKLTGTSVGLGVGKEENDMRSRRRREKFPI